MNRIFPFFKRLLRRVPVDRSAGSALAASGSGLLAAPVALCAIDVARMAILAQNESSLRMASALEREGIVLAESIVCGWREAAGGDLASGAGDGEPAVRFRVEAGPGPSARQLEVDAEVVAWHGHRALLCAVHDVSASAARQRQLQAQLHEAEASARGGARFLATMSHELRTPLHGLLGHLELLERSSLDEAQQRRVRRMGQSAQTLLQMINDVLDLSRIEANGVDVVRDEVAFEPVALIDRVALLYAPLALAKGVDLDISVDPAMAVRYRGAEARIEQVLRNLVSNAVKFTASGRIEVRAQAAQEGGLVFEVADSGIGMNAAQVQRLFQPWMQADASIGERYGGTGLGLALCRELCRQMGGEVHARSTPGVGSVFTFSVQAAAVGDGRQSSWQPLCGRRVLLQSAVATWREELARRLRSWGADVQVIDEEPMHAAAGGALLDTPAAEDAPLVLFERNRAAEQSRIDGSRIIRVRADGPLRAQPGATGWRVSCYTAQGLLEALLGMYPASAHLPHQGGALAAVGNVAAANGIG